MAADTGCNFRIPHPHFRFKRWTFLLVFLTLLHNTRTQENVNSQACEKVLSSGTVTYHACISKIEFLSFLNLDPIIEPENSTCGYETDPKNNEYCTLGYDQDCSECDATQPDLAHPAPYVIDTASSGGELTWWQSRSWLDFVSEDDDFIINVTLSMRKGYELSDKIKITFKSGRPQKMVILKSSNNGETWDPYQYYARDCVSAFGMEPKADPSDITDVTEVICTPAYSGSLPEKDGIVEFDLNFRLEKLFADTVGSDNDLSLFYEVFESDEIRNYIDVTDIRISLMYPATDGLETTLKPENLRNYFYAISDIYSSVRCQCNLHAENCNELSGGQYSCDCKHNTMGVNCELCLPLYNNRPWQAGSYLPYPSGTANECQLCDCNEHAANCSYDETVGKGVCEGCEDNTAGLFCEICVAGYYRNQSEPVNSPDVCIGCDCEPLGTLPTSENVTECSQYENDVTGQPVGQCSCIDFVTGRRCDECIDEYYGLKQVESAGLCKECGCKILGTVNASNVCEKTEGQCPCKPNTFERDCSRCKDGFYAFPSSTEMDCLACRCDYGGSYTQICNIVSGLCDCRPNLIGQRCNMVDSGYFYNYLDANSYDSWDAVSACSRESDLPIDYTGVGYLVCQDNTNVLFQNVKAFSVMSDIQKYLPVIRYSYNSSDNWYSASLSLSATGDSANQDLLHELAGDVDPDTSSGNTTDAPTTADITCSVQAGIIMSIAVVFTPGQDISWQPVNVEDDLLDVDRRCNYELNLQLMSSGDGADNIQIDSLVLMPVLTDFQVYKYGACDCNMNYSMGDTCTAHGGQCVCKTGVYGRQCDRCQPGYYNLTEDGCTPCNCDPLGSASLVCDFESGQCPCQEGVAGLSCQECSTGFKRASPDDGSYSICEACECPYIDPSADPNTQPSAQRATECEPDTGICIDCSSGSTGDFCEICKENVKGPDCDRCISFFYGFDTELFGGACNACNCNTTGTGGVMECDNGSGQCTCIGNYGGKQCARCKDNFYDYDSGCVPCDSCYDVIDEEMTKLRELTQNLTDFVGYLSSQDNTTELGPFYIRLQETEDVIMELAANINEAVAEEDDLNARIESLNGTMQTLMSLLSNDITNAVNETNVDINEAVDNVAGSKDTIDTIEQRITDSYNMLNSGTLEQAQITLQALQSDLNKLDIQITSAASSTTGDIADLEAQVDDMSTKTEAARQSALQALQTVQEAQLLHDNTTNRVSDLRSAATFVQQKSENLDSQATEMLSRAQSTNQEATAALTKAMSPNDNADTDVENLIDSASVKIAQAGAIENQATQALEQNLYIIDEVADAGNITDITLAEVNTVTADVTARYDRSTNAYTLANSALELSGATFDAANEMLNTLENFESIVDEVEQAADTAMDTVASVVELSNSATLEARAIQSELSDSELHADSALSIADEAFNMAEAERESVAPANNRANQLAEEAAAKLTDTDSLIQDVKSINTTLVAPQQAICNDYATTMDTLEATVLEATDQSNQALVMVAQTETDLKLLLASLENIGTIDTSQLSGYAERIAAARNTFTETDFAASIAALKIAVDEQQTWLDRTRLKVDSLQSQVDALESFRVTSG
uniref:Laminin subunit beta-1-like n=1 Tax=Saccoglossus kowalevskii TaxID=10224 RepID=A0ABM0MLH7_SACKO|nr:PREDICTED: laminin subunit beta-1-like [Saccoglossus kowalevskii]